MSLVSESDSIADLGATTTTSEARILEILLVEDDDVDALHMHRCLTKHVSNEVNVHRAVTLREALDRVQTHPPDLVLLDLSLPDASELSAVEAMAAHAPDSPLIVQTGSTDRSLAEEALKQGAQDYLTKDTLTGEVVERAIRYALVRHATQHELGLTSSQLAQTDAELDEFAHVVAHDLRAPVRTARLLGDRLLASLDNPSSAVADLGSRLDDTLNRVDRMILSMLDYSALRGAFPDREPVHLGRIAEQVASSIEADLTTAAATIEVDAAVEAYGNADLLMRVLQNLLVNSLKYARPGEPAHLQVTGRSSGTMVELQVRDNGLGVPPADRYRVFDILERLQPGAGSGLGFGLAICRRIVHGLDGEIWIEPSEGPGTTVTMKLPAASSALPDRA